MAQHCDCVRLPRPFNDKRFHPFKSAQIAASESSPGRASFLCFQLESTRATMLLKRRVPRRCQRSHEQVRKTQLPGIKNRLEKKDTFTERNALLCQSALNARNVLNTHLRSVLFASEPSEWHTLPQTCRSRAKSELESFSLQLPP